MADELLELDELESEPELFDELESLVAAEVLAPEPVPVGAAELLDLELSPDS